MTTGAWIDLWKDINKPSKKLFIAVTIAKKSFLGKELDSRILGMTSDPNKSPFPTNISNGIGPHITLLEMYIPGGSLLDIFLSDTTNFTSFVRQVKNIFIHNFTLNLLQLHSKKDNYKKFGQWITRVFDDNPEYEIIKTYYHNFRKEINYYLLSKITNNLTNSNFTSIIRTQPKLNIQDNNIQSFTHYSIKPNSYPNSENATSSFYTEWIPHISIANSTDPNFIENFKKAAKMHFSFINLWSISSKKRITMLNKDCNGDLEYIYCSYDTTGYELI